MDTDSSLIGVCVALVAQFAGAVWWGASLNTIVKENGRRITSLETAQAAALESGRLVSTQLARIDERTSIMMQRTDPVAEQRIRQAAAAAAAAGA